MSLEKEFITIVQEHSGIINSICRAYYPDADDLNDVRQDVLLQLWRAFPAFRREAKLSTWLYQVTLNTILTRRKKDRHQARNESIDEHHLNQLAAEANLPVEDAQEFSWLISQLDDDQKALLILSLEGYANKEIAGMLNLTPTNVSTRLNRIKTKLKDLYRHALR